VAIYITVFGGIDLTILHGAGIMVMGTVMDMDIHIMDTVMDMVMDMVIIIRSIVLLIIDHIIMRTDLIIMVIPITVIILEDLLPIMLREEILQLQIRI
jgi:hypothetical protein